MRATSLDPTALRKVVNRAGKMGNCGCAGQLSAVEPGGFPTWAKITIAVGFAGLIALVATAAVQERRYG